MKYEGYNLEVLDAKLMRRRQSIGDGVSVSKNYIHFGSSLCKRFLLVEKYKSVLILFDKVNEIILISFSKEKALPLNEDNRFDLVFAPNGSVRVHCSISRIVPYGRYLLHKKIETDSDILEVIFKKI